MKKLFNIVFLTAVVSFVLVTVSGATPITATTQSFVTDDQFADSRYPGSTSPQNYPEGSYLWSGHQQNGNIHSYTFLKFMVGEDWNWQTAILNIPFNYYLGSDGETSIWFNSNDSWTDSDITYGNLLNVWDFSNPILLAREFVQIENDPTQFSFDISSLIDHEDNDVVSLVIGSILPNEIAQGNYWRDIVNSEYLGGSSAAKLIGQDRQSPVPEPATMLLLGVGLIGIAGVSRKKATKA